MQTAERKRNTVEEVGFEAHKREEWIHSIRTLEQLLRVNDLKSFYQLVNRLTKIKCNNPIVKGVIIWMMGRLRRGSRRLTKSSQPV